MLIGNQNQGVKLGIYAVGSMHYGVMAVEAGLAGYGGYLFRRHQERNSGFGYGYDAFILAGAGRNQNLLVSSFFEDGPLLTSVHDNQYFYGLGFGVEKEYLPDPLNVFDQRLGKLLMRFSQGSSSVNVQIKNDVRSGNLFLGEGTDHGTTGMFQMSYSSIKNPDEVVHLGTGIVLFTARPDYARTPNNKINSDDGSKNVWHTLSPFPRLFYSNLYAFGGYQKQSVSAFLKAGMNSQKLGAYIQNILHDSFGLNPRFPWDVSAKDQLFIEGNASFFNGWIDE